MSAEPRQYTLLTPLLTYGTEYHVHGAAVKESVYRRYRRAIERRHLVALAVFVPPLAIFILIILAVYVISWYLVLFVLPTLIAKVGEALLERQAAVSEAIAEVIANCPESCRGDVSAPECEVSRITFGGS